VITSPLLRLAHSIIQGAMALRHRGLWLVRADEGREDERHPVDMEGIAVAAEASVWSHSRHLRQEVWPEYVVVASCLRVSLPPSSDVICHQRFLR
jgi:hypothetical protein